MQFWAWIAGSEKSLRVQHKSAAQPPHIFHIFFDEFSGVREPALADLLRGGCNSSRLGHGLLDGQCVREIKEKKLFSSHDQVGC